MTQGRPCLVCNHKQRLAIDKAILEGETLPHLAQRFTVSGRSLFNHKQKHIPASLLKAKQIKEEAMADTLLGRIQALESKAMELLSKAERTGKIKVALQGVREARACLELLAKLTGELQEGATVNVLVASPEWIDMRTVILTTLEDYPEAKAKLTEALEVNYAGS